ncbi:hypothetical protein K466DRAFT_569761 [Polyporus arcularius HHB13444]|uniref:Uncharacterized protein n=1 Tax=Polyporus arcularius HHB13444 TaxID=1314778 RepID=A0A5C3NV78_9APHY|nr:hypothetical protein K466DRAFT_569761 [Polyporus arcularius HHB13444]
MAPHKSSASTAVVLWMPLISGQLVLSHATDTDSAYRTKEFCPVRPSPEERGSPLHVRVVGEMIYQRFTDTKVDVAITQEVVMTEHDRIEELLQLIDLVEHISRICQY